METKDDRKLVRRIIAGHNALDRAGQHVAVVRIHENAADSEFARAREDAGRIEIQEMRRVVADRSVTRHHFNVAVQLRDVEQRGIRLAAGTRNERDADRKLEAGRRDVHLKSRLIN